MPKPTRKTLRSPAELVGVGLVSGEACPALESVAARYAVSLADSTVRSQFADLGHEIFPREQQTPEALGAFQKAEIEKWWPTIKAANIKRE
jgi:hypothetical protein